MYSEQILSGNNPLVNNFDLLGNIIEVNSHDSSYYTQNELNVRIGKIANQIKKGTNKPDFRDEATKMIKYEDIRNKLREKLKLLKKGDIVCDESQGQFSRKDTQGNNVTGQKACASICTVAVQMFLSENKITNQTRMYYVIKTGIDDHIKHGFKAEQFYEDVFNKTNEDRERLGIDRLKIVVPDIVKDKDDEEYLEMAKKSPLKNPLRGTVGKGFSHYLDVMQNVVRKNQQPLCGVITSKGETIVAYFPVKGKPQLFDSHGRSYKRVPKGASLRQFNNIKELDDHLKTIFKADVNPDTTYNIQFIGLEQEK